MNWARILGFPEFLLNTSYVQATDEELLRVFNEEKKRLGLETHVLLVVPEDLTFDDGITLGSSMKIENLGYVVMLFPAAIKRSSYYLRDVIDHELLHVAFDDGNSPLPKWYKDMRVEFVREVVY